MKWIQSFTGPWYRIGPWYKPLLNIFTSSVPIVSEFFPTSIYTLCLCSPRFLRWVVVWSNVGSIISRDLDICETLNMSFKTFQTIIYFFKKAGTLIYTLKPTYWWYTTSAWKSSPKTGKRPRLDWTKTAEDRKFPGPSKTATAVRSSVSNDFGNFKTDKRPV